MNWFTRLFQRKKPTSNPAPSPVPAPTSAPTPAPKPPTFVETFKNLDNWVVSTWTAPGTNSTHKGIFDASNVTLTADGLQLKLWQRQEDSSFMSHGGEVVTKQKFGYGKYEFVVKASADASGKPVSGSITGCFNYGPASITEIDFEVEGNERSGLCQFTSWKGETNSNESTKVPGIQPHTGFHKYVFIWSPGKVEFYRDDVLVATHTKVVPSEPAPFLFNHWGTNNVNWGGLATPGVERTMIVKSFSFTPL